MLQSFIPKLISDLNLGDTTLASGAPGSYTLPLGEGISINMSTIPNGFIFKSSIAPYPKVKEEIFSTQVMMANLFGRSTRGAVLGLNLEGDTLTLTHVIDYPVDYKEFKYFLEDFINTVDFWREEALNPSAI